MYNNIYNAIIIVTKIHWSMLFLLKITSASFFMYNISDLISGKKIYDTTHRQDK